MIMVSDIPEGAEEILSKDALDFLEELQWRFEPFLNEELVRRKSPKATAENLEIKIIEEQGWTVAPIPEDMRNRTVEITGPVDRKMVINALNSGANCFMADFEDSNSPTWENCVYGQVNMRDAVNRTISLKTGKKQYQLNDNIAKLMVRPRGLHLKEKNVIINDRYLPAALFDFGLFMFHNAKTLVERGETPAFYLPKLESSHEAAWWEKVISYTEERLGVPGSVRVTVLIETLPAAFEMQAILYELRNHIAGLNAGRWDYIFSAIKVLGADPNYVFPNRSQVTMKTHMMHSYAQLIVQTCHAHGAQAMGGMAAQIPRKDDMLANQKALAKVRLDKELEARMGYDGTWVAHPGLVEIARERFKTIQDRGTRESVKNITKEDLLQVPTGSFTYDELYNNVRVSLAYMYNWSAGNGCVAIDYLMEDLATVEISRAQVWQWLYHGVELDGGEGKVDEALVDIVLDQVVKEHPEYEAEAELFANLVKRDACAEFTSIPMYEKL